MTTTNHSDAEGRQPAEPSQLLKTDALGRTRMSRAQREIIRDTLKPAA